MRAAGNGSPHAEPRRELFTAKRRAQQSRARTATVSYALSGTRDTEGRLHYGVWCDGRSRSAADAKRRHHAARIVQSAALAVETGFEPQRGFSPAPDLAKVPPWSTDCLRNLLDALASGSHEIEVLEAPYADTMGHAGAVVLHPTALA